MLMLVAFFVRGAMLSKVEVVHLDETYFIRLGEHLAEGGSFADFNFSRVTYVGQPLLPCLFSWAGRAAKDPVRACQMVSLLFGVLTLIPFHLCARNLVSLPAAFGSDLVYVLSPYAVEYSLCAMPHSFFNFFFVSSLYFALKSQKAGQSGSALFMGGALCLAYLTRPEGIVFAAVLFAASLVLGVLRLSSLLIFLSSFAIFSIPYWIWIRKTTGVWQLIWSQGAGALGIYREFVAGRSPAVFFTSYLRNLYFATSLLPKILPLSLCLLIALGLVEVLRKNRTSSRSIFIVILFSSLPFFIYPAFLYVEARFLSPSAVLFTLFSGAGILAVWESVKKWKATQLVWPVLLILSFVPGYRSLLLSFREEPVEARHLGEWIQGHLHQPQVLFGSDIRVCFYAGRNCKRYVSMRSGTSSFQNGISFEQWIRQENVDLVVADTRYIPKFFPSFQFLLDRIPKDQLERLVELTEGDQTITLYRVR